MGDPKTREAAARAEDRSGRRLIQGLGLFDGTMLVAGSMIGSGIYIVSADIGRTVGSPGWLIGVWAISGLMTFLGALSYGELAALFPRAGGQYAYLREAWGPLVAFLYGWTFFLVIQTGTIAAVAVAFAKFLAVFFPALGEETVLLSAALPGGLEWRVSPAQLVAVGLIVILTAVNLLGIRTGKRVQNVFTVAKVGSLVAVVALGAGVGLGLLHVEPGRAAAAAASTAAAPAGAALALAIGAAMVGALFSSDAWNSVTFTAAETRDARRTVPLALALGAGIVILLYLAASAAYLQVLDFGEIAAAPRDRVGTAMLEKLFGPRGELAMAAAILVSTFGCNNGLILSGGRVTYAMARDGLFFPAAGELNRAGAPGTALVWQGVVASVLALSGSYGKLLDFVIFATLLFYVLTVAGIFVLRRTRPDEPRPYRAPGYPLLPGLYVAMAAAVAAALLIHPQKRVSSLIGLAIVIAGIPVYALLKARSWGTASASGVNGNGFGGDRPSRNANGERTE